MAKPLPDQIAAIAGESQEFMRAVKGHAPEVDQLRADLDVAKRRWSNFNALNRAGPSISLLLAGALLGIFFWSGEAVWLYISVFYMVVAIVIPILNFGEASRAEIEALETEIILRVTGAEAVEQRAERLFKSHEIGLRRYYQQTLRHSNVIFFTGVGCIAIGFGIIGYCLYVFSARSDTLETPEKVVVAAFGIASGILTNFVAIIYLRIFSEVVKSLNSFHGKLVATNHLHFANLLLSKVAKLEVRDNTLSKLALQLASPDPSNAAGKNGFEGKEDTNA